MTVEVERPATFRACVFALGGELFALDVAAVREVAIFEDLTAMPLAPPHVLGVGNLRGVVMPIVDPRALLGRPPVPVSRRMRTLVTSVPAGDAALLVDDVLGLEALEPLAAVESEAWLAGRARWDGRDVMLLDAAALLAALRP